MQAGQGCVHTNIMNRSKYLSIVLGHIYVVFSLKDYGCLQPNVKIFWTIVHYSPIFFQLSTIVWIRIHGLDPDCYMC